MTICGPGFSIVPLSSQEAINQINKLQYDIGFVYGTRRLSSDFINAFLGPLYNFHGGDTESYRGLDSHLWAIYHKDRNGLILTMHLVDEILNAALFVLIGFQVIMLSSEISVWIISAISVGVAVVARWIAVATPLTFLSAIVQKERGEISILTWAGLKGGISIALALSLPDTMEYKGIILTAAYAVVVFSILIQGLTIEKLITHYHGGDDNQKQTYLPKIASGELRLQAFGVTEPSSGTDTTRIRTMAVKEDGGYRVTGQKVWTSRAEHSDLMLLLARTSPREDQDKRHNGMSVFLLEMREAVGAGLTIRPIRTMINHATTEIFFDDFKIPADSLIGEEGKGFRYILDGMNAERILISAECVGDARWFIERAADYARNREVFDRPIGQNQGIQFPMARAYAQTEAAALMLEKAADLFDTGEPCGAEANMAKMLTSEAAGAAAEMCIQTHGGYGFAEEYDVERKFRENRLYQVAPISTNMVLTYLSEHVLKLPRSY